MHFSIFLERTTVQCGKVVKCIFCASQRITIADSINNSSMLKQEERC